MKKASNVTALLAGILLLVMAGSREWLSDVWRQLKPIEKIFWASLLALAIGAAFWVGVVPIVWQWFAWVVS